MEKDEYLTFGKPDFSGGEIDAITRVMQSGWVGMGSETIEFEQELAAYLNIPHVITVNSCTSALMLSLLASGVGPGDEVICPSLTWCSSANAALYLGAKPVFCDIDPTTLCLTEKSVMDKITEKTKAIVVVHFGGLAVDVRKLRLLIPHGINIIEDAAHAIGSLYSDETPVGSSGNLTCFSFYANKNLSTGEGGAISVADTGVADRLRSLRQHGLVADAWKRFIHPKSMLSADILELGYKMNYTDLQASIGRVQLKRQPEFHERRLSIAKIYYEELAGREHGMEFQSDILSDGHARHLFVVKLPLEKLCINRNDFVLALRDRHVGATIHYTPLHLMKFYSEMRDQPLLPNTENIFECILTLPISASITVNQARYIVSQFNSLVMEHLK
jgi:dTDP-4-amino-4,6-dideoxygalactose transaminase